MVKIDAQKFKEFCKEYSVKNGCSLSEIGIRLGRASSYYWNVINKPKIASSAFESMRKLFGVDAAESLKYHVAPVIDAETDVYAGDYELHMQIKNAGTPEIMRLTLCSKSGKQYSGMAIIHGKEQPNETDVCKAVQDAAINLYHCYQNDLLRGCCHE